MPKRSFRSLLVLAALVTGATLSGCSIGTRTRSTISDPMGITLSLVDIEPGTSREHVLSIFGEPAEKTPMPDGTELWKWHYSERTESDTSVIVSVSKSDTTIEHTTCVEFKDGVVVRSWRD